MNAIELVLSIPEIKSEHPRLYSQALGELETMKGQSARIAELEARVKELEAWKSEARQVLTSIVANPAVQDKIEADKQTNYLIRDARAMLETK